MPATKLVRIKPEAKRVRHVFEGLIFDKDRGWYEIPADVADRLAHEKAHELPTSEAPLLFDVQDKEAAVRVHEVETRKEDPAGTPEKPSKAVVIPPPPPDESPSPRRGRRG
jgi:hypothetical protein